MEKNPASIMKRITLQVPWRGGYTGIIYVYVDGSRGSVEENYIEWSQLSYDAELDAIVIKAGGYQVYDDAGYMDAGWDVDAHASRLAIRGRELEALLNTDANEGELAAEETSQKGRATFDYENRIPYDAIKGMQNMKWYGDLHAVFSYGHVAVRLTRRDSGVTGLTVGEFRPVGEGVPNRNRSFFGK